MYIIVQLCCFDCNKLINLYLCHDNNYLKFIKNLEDFELYCYIIYDLNLNEIIRLDF